MKALTAIYWWLTRVWEAAGVGLIVLTIGLLIVSGCSHHPALKDAPITGTDLSGAHIVNMPDEFPNVAWKCAGVNGLYVNTRSAGVNFIVITNDPNCQVPG